MSVNACLSLCIIIFAEPVTCPGWSLPGDSWLRSSAQTTHANAVFRMCPGANRIVGTQKKRGPEENRRVAVEVNTQNKHVFMKDVVRKSLNGVGILYSSKMHWLCHGVLTN